jgi:hypothetical protein
VSSSHGLKLLPLGRDLHRWTGSIVNLSEEGRAMGNIVKRMKTLPWVAVGLVLLLGPLPLEAAFGRHHLPRASTPSLVRGWLKPLPALRWSSTWRTRLRSRTRQFWRSSRRQVATSLPQKRPLAWDITWRCRSSAPTPFSRVVISARRWPKKT